MLDIWLQLQEHMKHIVPDAAGDLLKIILTFRYLKMEDNSTAVSLKLFEEK
jgi:hypothetical protein